MIRSQPLVQMRTLFTSLLLIHFVSPSILPIRTNNISHVNYYYVVTSIGNPPQQLALLIDTSSSHTYINPPYTSRRNRPTQKWKNKFLYKSQKSSTFAYLTCMDAEHCNDCPSRCAWEFASEQMYIMAKDVIHLSPNTNGSDDYLFFGYNAGNQGRQPRGRSHIFSLDAYDDHMMMGGILSLNRKQTSFIQQLYIQHPTHKYFAHYFNRNKGYMAFGEDVNALIQQLNIASADIEWMAYHDNDEWLYQVNLTRVTLDDDIIFEGDGYLTFDTAVTGIVMSERWRDIILQTLNVELVETTYIESGCINTDRYHEDLLNDLFNVLPDINIALSANAIYTISPEQYVVNVDNDTVHYQFCLDITFDEYEGVCLGSHVMENYLIIYNDERQSIGIYDNNARHQSQRNIDGSDEADDDLQTMDTIAESIKDKKYIYALSLALVAILICLLFVSAICVALLHRVASTRHTRNGADKYRKNEKRRSVTVDGFGSPQHIMINSAKTKQESLELNWSDSNRENEDNLSVSSSVSPLQSYYDGNVKSIVYDRIIRPWNSDEEKDGI